MVVVLLRFLANIHKRSGIMTGMNVEVLKSNIEKLVNQRGESKTKAFTNSGVGKDFFTNLNKGQIPSVEKIISLADYFSVSVDFLLGRTDNPSNTQKGITTGDVKSINVNGDTSVKINTTVSKETAELMEMLQNLTLVERSKVVVMIDEMKKNNNI